MGMFDSFLGQNDGYTKAQRTGLGRSAEIKKKRKEDERAFELKKIKDARKAKAMDKMSQRKPSKALSDMQKNMGQAMKQQAEANQRASEAMQKRQDTGLAVKNRLARDRLLHKDAMEKLKFQAANKPNKPKSLLEQAMQEGGTPGAGAPGAGAPGAEASEGTVGERARKTLSPGEKPFDLGAIIGDLKRKNPKEMAEFVDNLYKTNPDLLRQLMKRQRESGLTNAQKFEPATYDPQTGGGSIYQKGSGTYTNIR